MQFDIAIIGGGLTGVAAARLAAKRGFRVVHFAPEMAKDHRTSALMMPTVEFMVQSGLLPVGHDVGTRLRNIRIIDATNRLVRAPEALFKSEEIDLDAFGYNYANAKLLDAFSSLEAELETIHQTVKTIEQSESGYLLTSANGEQHQATLLVGADGKKSKVREQLGFQSKYTAFRQSALVADIEFDRVESETSVEFHYPNGPFTLVPAGGNKINLVWLDRHDVLEDAAKLSPEAFATKVEEMSFRLFGHAKPISKAFVFPLSNLTVPVVGKDGAMLIGEAAHAFPPIGAQGLNLGLRDVEDFLEAIANLKTGFSAQQAIEASNIYAKQRSSDLQRTGGFVDGLFKSLLSDFLPAQCLRMGGLWALKSIKPLRKFAFEIGMGK
ncbi:FAD-dependent monooxygenase [Maritalea sp.]|uniref:FAD-dependent monooxygenase n=1 Tax=Maritalea sp. TaxID=2003361 RepID=UPI003EF94CDB